MARKSTIAPISKFGEILKVYPDSQGMTYTDLELKLNTTCSHVHQWVAGVLTNKGRKVVYPDAVNLKILSNVIPSMWFKMLWDAIPTREVKGGIND
jgi:hypothetical protein